MIRLDFFTKDVFSLLFQLHFNHFLGSLATCLSWEVHHDGNIVSFLTDISQETFCHNRLKKNQQKLLSIRKQAAFKITKLIIFLMRFRANLLIRLTFSTWWRCAQYKDTKLIRTKSRVLYTPFHCHLTFPSCCWIRLRI